MKLKLGLTAATVIGLAAGQACANPPSLIYSNGAPNGTIDALNIGAYAVADSFAAENGSVISQVNFWSWQDIWPLEPVTGHLPTTVTWTIGDGNPLTTGSIIATGTATINYTLLSSTPNQWDLLVYSDWISIPDVVLNDGSSAHYYLELSNAYDSSGFPTYWDMNEGPSQAYQTGYNGVPSEFFQILGTPSLAPEPAGWALLLAGFAGLGATLRRRQGSRARPSPGLAAKGARKI